MKKVLIIIGLVFSVISAGDIIGGVELSKPMPKDKKFKGMNLNTKTCALLSCNKITAYRNDKIKFFDDMEIEVDGNNTARGITYVKTYKVSIYTSKTKSKEIEKDFKRILKKLESKYGEFDKSEAQGILKGIALPTAYYMRDIKEVCTLKNPKSENIGQIILMLMANDGKGKKFITGSPREVTLMVVYIDKKLIDAMEKKKESELDDL